VEGQCALAESERRTLLDPLAAALLLARPRVGVMQTVANITIAIRAVALDVWVSAARGFQVGGFVRNKPVHGNVGVGSNFEITRSGNIAYLLIIAIR
jgi:hypothetical protein